MSERKQRRRKAQRRVGKQVLAISAAAGLLGLTAQVRADVLANINGSTSTDLSQAANWFDETTDSAALAAPGFNDVAQWDSMAALTTATTFDLNAAASWLGIVIQNPGAAVTIGGGTDTANTLTLGASGIGMSAASQNLTIDDPMSLGAAQTWNVAGGQTLLIADFTANPTGITTNLNGDALTITGSGNTTFGTSTAFQSAVGGTPNPPPTTANTNSIIGAGTITKNGTGTLTISSASNTITSVTVNSGTFTINMSAASASGASSAANVPVGTIITGGGTVLTAGGSRLSGSSGDFAFVENPSGLSALAGDTSFLETRGSSGRTIDQFSGTPTRAVGATVNFTDVVASAGTNNANSGGYRLGTGALVNGVVPWITYTTTTAGSSPGGSLIPGNPLAQSWFVAAGTSNNGTAYATASYTDSNDTSLGTSTQNVDVVNGTSTNNANITGEGATTVNTLRFNSGNSHQIIMGTTDTLTIGTGGILVTGSYADHIADITGGTLMGGNPGSGSGNDLMIIDYADPNNNSNNELAHIQVDSVIADNNTTSPGPTALTKSGTGTLIITNTANTYTGDTYLNDGVTQIAGEGTTYGSLGTIPLTPLANDITFTGGTLQLGAGFNLNPNRGITLNPKGGTFDTNGFASTYGGVITGSGPFSKVGINTLRLSSANTYTGNTTISAGTLSAVNTTGSATGSGNVIVGASGTLSGSGSISGNVSLSSSGGQIAPGDAGVGTLSVGSLNFATGNVLDVEFANNTSYDRLNVTATNGLTLSGGGINLYTVGTTSPYAPSGDNTFDLFQFAGTLSGSPTSLSVLNPQAGFTYNFGTSGQFVTLEVIGGGSGPIVSTWNTTLSNQSWSAPGNWTNGVPHNPGDTANFAGIISAATSVNVDGAESLGTLDFNNASAYTLAAAGGSIIMNTGVSTAAQISVLLGNHVIAAPITLTSSVVVTTTNPTDSLEIDGSIGGGGALTAAGLGTLILTGANTYGGNTTINSGSTLQLGSATVPASGNLGGTNLTDNGTFKIALSSNYSFGGTINGSGSVVQSGAGITTLGAANGYQGGTSITAGTLKMGNATALGTGSVTITSPGILDVNATGPTLPGIAGNGTVDNTAAAATTIILNPSTDVVFTGAITNTGGTVTLDKQGSATQTLNGADTYGGNTTIDAGNLSINSDASLGLNTAGNVTINAGTLEANASFSTARTIILANAASTIQADTGVTLTDTLTSGITGTALTKTGAGTLTVDGPLTLTGTATVTGGILELQSPTNTLTTAPTVSGTGATLQIDSTAALSVSAITVASGSSATGLVHVMGGNFTVTGTTTLGAMSDSGGGGVIQIESGSTVNLGPVNFNTTSDGGLISILGGSVNIGAVTVGRSGATAAKTADFNKGIVINGSTANVTMNALTLGTANSFATLSVENGSLDITGPFIVSDLSSNTSPARGGEVQVTGGILTSTDPNGMQMAANTTSSTTAIQAAIATFSGGTTSLYGVNMFPEGAAAGTSFSATVNVGDTSGTSTGSLYLGAGGIMANVTTGGSPSVILNGGTIVLGATANWTSPATIPWTDSSGPAAAIIQAADSLGNPFNIEIDGPITGTGAMTKTGGGILTLGGANQLYVSNIEVNQGTLALGLGGSVTETGVDVNPGTTLSFVAQTAGTGPLARTVFQINLNGGNAVVDTAPAPQNLNRSVVVTTSLNINSGTLDLSNNDMIVQSAGAGGLAQLTAEVASGYNGGHWNGTTGITSSTAAGTNNTAIGIEQNDNGSGTPLMSTFDGQPVGDQDVLLKYTYFGDANLDGVVNGDDYTLIDNGFNNNLTGWHNGDFNYDGIVNGDDYTLIDNAFNTQGASLAAAPAEMVAVNTSQIAGGSSAAVPEPASVALLGAAGIGLLSRRRRRMS